MATTTRTQPHTCDAQLATDDDGVPGRQTAIVAVEKIGDPGTASVSVGTCIGSVSPVWHGKTDPAYACARHGGSIAGGRGMVSPAVFAGHRNRANA